jgi:hypothetical protein
MRLVKLKLVHVLGSIKIIKSNPCELRGSHPIDTLTDGSLSQTSPWVASGTTVPSVCTSLFDLKPRW